MPRPHAVNAFSSAAHINLIEWAIVSVEGAGGAGGGGETSAQNMRIKMTRLGGTLHSLLLSVALSSYNVREGEGRRKREQEGGDRGGQREREEQQQSASSTASFQRQQQKKNGPLKMFMTHAAGSPQKRWPAACGMWQSVWHMIN